MFNPIWGKIPISKGLFHHQLVTLGLFQWLEFFFVYHGRPLGIRLLLLAKRKEAENTKLQHISPTIVRSLIYLLAISRIAMEMTISVL